MEQIDNLFNELNNDISTAKYQKTLDVLSRRARRLNRELINKSLTKNIKKYINKQYKNSEKLINKMYKVLPE